MIEITRPSWHQRAACRGVDPAIFFPERGRSSLDAVAREFCSACPVSAACALEGLMLPQQLDHGMWAGMSTMDRRDARRRVGIGGPRAKVVPEPRPPLVSDPPVPVASEARRADLADLLAGDDPASITADDVLVLAELLDAEPDRIKKDLRVLAQDRVRARSAGGLARTGHTPNARDTYLETAT